ncbi:unnamed protein product [Paramecium octaurelia]|uniref:Uncharacterized protein n=1 Tax=Paramecium octaurelia TaxID=43137 RepID=A0A8S1WPJ3_PAROT|nr:unnamed protein product [Paramecium octaurelia]
MMTSREDFTKRNMPNSPLSKNLSPQKMMFCIKVKNSEILSAQLNLFLNQFKI